MKTLLAALATVTACGSPFTVADAPGDVAATDAPSDPDGAPGDGGDPADAPGMGDAHARHDAHAGREGGADAPPGHDAPSGDALPTDAPPGDAPACLPPIPIFGECGAVHVTSKEYCVFGEGGDADGRYYAATLPVECMCAKDYTCACIVKYSTDPCAGLAGGVYQGCGDGAGTMPPQVECN